MIAREELSIRDVATRILARRAYSAGEMVEKLVERGYGQDEAELTAEWLMDLRYLDDERLAADLVKSLIERPYGIHRIRQELKRRRLDEQVIEEALELLPEDELESVLDAWIAKRVNAGAWEPQKRRLADMLYRRGFDWGDIRSALFRYEMERDEEAL